ncbi:MAG: 2-amino-4-hydroxy-6-hydroxymethyldihydropteridine diphosphokinase [Kiloniellales bacterium]|nr:2-amino-4-hydroxy-6-hydroxymethyldihydropteridine diphosphokinase [Kiloniellales bacterium]
MADRDFVLIGLGANLDHPEHGGPKETLEAALGRLEEAALRILARSRWYRSAPVPASDQPWFVNGVAAVETVLEPAALLARLHALEADFGRRRAVRNAARTLDLDLLDYRGRVSPSGALPELPHPRLAGRAFVLLPLAEVAPGWRHPVSGLGLKALIARLPADQQTVVLE